MLNIIFELEITLKKSDTNRSKLTSQKSIQQNTASSTS